MAPVSRVARTAVATHVISADNRSPLRVGPFESLRTRTVIPWMIVCGLVLVAAFDVFALLTPLNADDPETAEVAFGFAAYGALAAWIAWACRRSGIGLGRLLGTLPGEYGRPAAWVGLFLLLAVTMAFSAGSWYVFAYTLSLFAPGVLELLLKAIASEPDPTIGYRLAMAAIVVIVAPVLEEGFFRGILVNRWGLKWGMGKALVASSLAFGILHANPAGIGVVGLVAALLYIRTRTLIVPVVFHAANNIVATVGELVSDLATPLDTAAEIRGIRDDIYFGALLVLVTLPVLVWYIRRNWPARDAALPYLTAGLAASTFAPRDGGFPGSPRTGPRG